jgi:uncharacterized membrane protein
MNDRSRTIFITVLAVLLFLFPGIAGICFGLVSVFDSVLGFNVFANDLNTYLWFIIGGLCGGLFLVLLSVVVIIFALRKRTVIPSPADQPSPPSPGEPTPPPDEPIPPAI